MNCVGAAAGERTLDISVHIIFTDLETAYEILGT